MAVSEKRGKGKEWGVLSFNKNVEVVDWYVHCNFEGKKKKERRKV